MMKKNFLVVGFLVWALSACEGQGTQDGSQFVRSTALSEGSAQLNGPVDFAAVKKAVIDPYCLRCHKEMVDEDSIKKFIVAGRADDSVFYQVIVDQLMPPPRARARGVPSEADLILLKTYIDSL